MEYIRYAFEILIVTLLFAIPGLFIESWIDAQGFAPSDKVSMIIGVLISVLIKTIWFHSTSWWPWGIAMLVAMIFAGHRGDIWMTMKKGRWWWKTENKNSDS